MPVTRAAREGVSSAWAQDHARGLLSGDKVNRRLYDLLSESLGFEATLGNLSHAYSNIKRQEEDVRPAPPAHRCCCFTAFKLEATAAQNRSGDARVWPGSVARHEAVLLVPLPRACRNEHTLRPLSARRTLLPARRTGAGAAAATRTRCATLFTPRACAHAATSAYRACTHTPRPRRTQLEGHRKKDADFKEQIEELSKRVALAEDAERRIDLAEKIEARPLFLLLRGVGPVATCPVFCARRRRAHAWEATWPPLV